MDLPPLLDFFTQWFVNVDADRQCLLARPSLSAALASVAERAVESRLDRLGEEALAKLRQDFSIEVTRDISEATGALATTMLTDYAQPADEEEIWSICEGNARVKR